MDKPKEISTHEYSGSFTGLADMVPSISNVGIGGNVGVIKAPPGHTPGMLLALSDDHGIVGTVETGEMSYSDALHQLGGQISGNDNYDTLHITGKEDELAVFSTNFSTEQQTGSLTLSYSTDGISHFEFTADLEHGEAAGIHREYGNTKYELTNHLSNVQTVISNRFLFGDSTKVKLADIYSYSDYYAYGSLKPERYYNPDDYSRAFQGMEKDDEVKGVGNSYTTFFRQYDPRLGVWFSTDPVVHPWMSSYAAFNLNPIVFSDPRGNTAQCDNCPEDEKFDFFREHEGNWGYNDDGTVTRIPDGVVDLPEFEVIDRAPNRVDNKQLLGRNPNDNLYDPSVQFFRKNQHTYLPREGHGYFGGSFNVKGFIDPDNSKIGFHIDADNTMRLKEYYSPTVTVGATGRTAAQTTGKVVFGGKVTVFQDDEPYSEGDFSIPYNGYFVEGGRLMVGEVKLDLPTSGSVKVRIEISYTHYSAEGPAVPMPNGTAVIEKEIPLNR